MIKNEIIQEFKAKINGVAFTSTLAYSFAMKTLKDIEIILGKEISPEDKEIVNAVASYYENMHEHLNISFKEMKAEIKNVFEGQINEVSFRDQELYNAVFDVIRNLENKKTKEGKKIKIENPIFTLELTNFIKVAAFAEEGERNLNYSLSAVAERLVSDIFNSNHLEDVKFYDFLDYEEEFFGNDELKNERAEFFEKINGHLKKLLTK